MHSAPTGPYCRNMHRSAWCIQGGGLFLMSEIPLSTLIPTPENPEPYRGTSLIRNNLPLAPYCSTMHRALWCFLCLGILPQSDFTQVTSTIRRYKPTSRAALLFSQ